jgi:hypothetical protein
VVSSSLYHVHLSNDSKGNYEESPRISDDPTEIRNSNLSLPNTELGTEQFVVAATVRIYPIFFFGGGGLGSNVGKNTGNPNHRFVMVFFRPSR